jgi:hypothetical protein
MDVKKYLVPIQVSIIPNHAPATNSIGVLTESSKIRASGTTASFCANLDTPQPSTEL